MSDQTVHNKKKTVKLFRKSSPEEDILSTYCSGFTFKLGPVKRLLYSHLTAQVRGWSSIPPYSKPSLRALFANLCASPTALRLT
jgi:hypothetical protein